MSLSHCVFPSAFLLLYFSFLGGRRGSQMPLNLTGNRRVRERKCPVTNLWCHFLVWVNPSHSDFTIELWRCRLMSMWTSMTGFQQIEEYGQRKIRDFIVFLCFKFPTPLAENATVLFCFEASKMFVHKGILQSVQWPYITSTLFYSSLSFFL